MMEEELVPPEEPENFDDIPADNEDVQADFDAEETEEEAGNE